MTYKEIYGQFLSTSGIDKNKVADYRPATSLYIDDDIANGIVVYLKDGNRLIYIADVEIKGYVYFKDESKEREVITEYVIKNNEHVTFKTKSGWYAYYVTHEDIYIDNKPVYICQVHQFGKIEESFTPIMSHSGEVIYDHDCLVKPCDVEMIEILVDKLILSRKWVHI